MTNDMMDSVMMMIIWCFDAFHSGMFMRDSSTSMGSEAPRCSCSFVSLSVVYAAGSYAVEAYVDVDTILSCCLLLDAILTVLCKSAERGEMKVLVRKKNRRRVLQVLALL